MSDKIIYVSVAIFQIKSPFESFEQMPNSFQENSSTTTMGLFPE